jgi:hypothetical protein
MIEDKGIVIRAKEDIATRVKTTIALLVVATCAISALGVASAPARTYHPFLGSFAGEGTPAGSFGDPNGLAIDESTGDVYVADLSHNVVDKFSSTGEAVDFGLSSTDALSGSGTPAGSFSFPHENVSYTPAGLAVDNSPISPSKGDLYVVDAGHGVIDKFEADGAYVGQLTEAEGKPFSREGGFGGPYGVAVDPLGNVWVYEPTGAVDEFDASGTFLGRFPTGCEEASPGIAVSSTDEVYVNCDATIEKFGPKGESLLTLPPPGVAYGVAVDQSNDHVFVDVNADVPVEYDAAGEFLRQLQAAGAFQSRGGGIAVSDTTGVYLSNAQGQRVYHWGPLVTVPDVKTEPPSGVQPTQVTLHGTVNPDGKEVTSCEFEFGETASYGSSVPCATEPGSGSAPVPIAATATALQPDTEYHYRLSASNNSGTNLSEDATFTTTGAPVVEATLAENLRQTAATLEARINPNGFDTTYHFEYGTTTNYGQSVPIPDEDIGSEVGGHGVAVEANGLTAGVTYHFRVVATSEQGAVNGPDHTFTTIAAALIRKMTAKNVAKTSATLTGDINPLENDTTYHFEYGPSTEYGTNVPIPDGDVGAGSSLVPVTVMLSGLSPNTTYHYRLVAKNSLGITLGADHTFAYDTGEERLPDNRAYEMVTPPQKNGAHIGRLFQSIVSDVARNGSRVIMPTIQCFGEVGSCDGDRGLSVGAPYSFTRTSSGWVAAALAPEAQMFDSPAAAYLPDAGTDGVLFSIEPRPSSADSWFAREPDGTFREVGPVTDPAKGPQGPEGRGFIGSTATADYSRVVYTVPTEQSWLFDPTVGGGFTVYEYAGSGLAEPELVGVTGGRGSRTLVSTCGTVLTTLEHGFNVLSADGETVFFTALAPTKEQNCSGPAADELLARVEQSRTVPISVRSPADCTSSGCLTSAPSAAYFDGASESGTKVYFNSTQRLTDTASQDSTAPDAATATGAGNNCFETVGRNGCNLYLYDFSAPTGHNLIDVSAGDTSGGGPRVRGVLAVSSDASHVYFVAEGVLASSANAHGQTAQAGADNLYVYERDASHPNGEVSFIAEMTPADEEEWGTNSPAAPANTTPDGRYLVFLSHSELTGEGAQAESSAQVYRYDAQMKELTRISISRHGFNDNGNAGFGDARIVEPNLLSAGPTRPDPTMSDDGSFVFFTSPVGLTRGALNDVQINSEGLLAENVYEYHDGEVSLISNGRDTSEYQSQSGINLLGSDASGANVFFTTAATLVPADTDSQFDLYDARTCTASEPCIAPAPQPPLPCQGEACHGTPPAIPSLLAPGSASFNGQGNIVPSPSTTRVKSKAKSSKCKKGFTKKHGKCVKSKGRKKAKRVKRASNDRRTHR